MEISPTIFIVPTGIGCEVGGFAGDALPTAKLLASASGCLITHPNVMNGGTLSEKDKNIFYVFPFGDYFILNNQIRRYKTGTKFCLFQKK